LKQGYLFIVTEWAELIWRTETAAGCACQV
jgi:hypothetical protein